MSNNINKLSFSRDGQDRYLIDNIFNQKKFGYFIDIGASDGYTENNTFLFEKYYNWFGICCECDPRDIDKLTSCRDVPIISCPIFKTTGSIITFDLHPANHLSGISNFIVNNYRNANSKKTLMTTISLNDCLSSVNAPSYIDYMSLDTEGSEYEILSSLNFDNYKIKYIAVEHNFQSPKRENIHTLLEQKGYVLNRSIVCDDEYILKN